MASNLRQIRETRGINQNEFARRIGISRQALGAIEAGVYQPGVTVALKIARELGETVEGLFGGVEEDECRRVAVRWPQGGPRAGAPLTRVSLGRIGGRIVAVEQPAAHLALSAVAGRIEHAGRTRAEVTTFQSRDEIDTTLLIAGCDPAATMLADWLARRRSSVRAVALTASSSRALTAVMHGRAHAAGVHMRDPRSGEYNLASVRRVLGRRPATVVNFARWESGLATAAGNPLDIRAAADLARRGIRIVNRERGSGARAALDEALKEIGLRAENVAGYGVEVGGHLEVAAAIATGQADTGMTIRVAAEAYGLGFVPIREERYDLVILESERERGPVKAMLDALNSRRFAREVSQICGYDTSAMGTVIVQPS